MENSTKHRSTASSIVQDPFRDPNVSRRTSISGPSSNSSQRGDIHETRAPIPIEVSIPLSNSVEHGGMGGIPPPRAPIPVHTRDSSSSSVRRQQQSRHVPPRSRYGNDEILPVPPIGQPAQGVPFQKPWNEKTASLGDESTSSGLSTRRPIPDPLDRRPEKIKAGRRWILVTKWTFICVLVSAK